MGDWIGCIWEFFMQCNGKIHGNPWDISAGDQTWLENSRTKWRFRSLGKSSFTKSVSFRTWSGIFRPRLSTGGYAECTLGTDSLN